MSELMHVDFQGDTIWAAKRADEVLIAVKPICVSLAIDWAGQLQRIKRDTILSEGMCMIHIPSPSGTQETMCLPLNLIPGFLFGIDDSRIKDETIRQRVLSYKRECYAVLYDYFFSKPEVPLPPPSPFIMPGDADFGDAVRLVREARLTQSKEAALALWRMLRLPWPEISADKTQIRFDDSSVQQFVTEALERRLGVSTPFTSLWRHYLDFCQTREFAPITEKGFAMHLSRFGLLKRKIAGRMVYYNIMPKPAEQSAI